MNEKIPYNAITGVIQHKGETVKNRDMLLIETAYKLGLTAKQNEVNQLKKKLRETSLYLFEVLAKLNKK